MRIKFPLHPRSHLDDYVYEHILVVEKALGFHIGKDAVVHHVDGNGLNNVLSNLMVFRNQADHTRFHKLHIIGGSMSPSKKCTMNGNKVEQYYWNGKYVTYVNDEKTEETYLQACDRLYNSPKKFKFQKVYCSQCGKEFGPRDSGYSHCEDHRKDALSI